MNEAPSKLTPALIGGALIAVFSTIPFLNCCCCLWVIGGGAVAAILYGKSLPPENEFSGSDGAIPGLLAGIFGALFSALLSYVMVGIFNINSTQDMLDMLMATGEDIPEELTEYIDDFEDTDIMAPAFVMIQLFFSLITNAILATVGGIIGASFYKRKPAEQTGYSGY